MKRNRKLPEFWWKFPIIPQTQTIFQWKGTPIPWFENTFHNWYELPPGELYLDHLALTDNHVCCSLRQPFVTWQATVHLLPNKHSNSDTIIYGPIFLMIKDDLCYTGNYHKCYGTLSTNSKSQRRKLSTHSLIFKIINKKFATFA